MQLFKKKMALVLGLCVPFVTACDGGDGEGNAPGEIVDVQWDESDRALYVFPRVEMDSDELEAIADECTPDGEPEFEGMDDLTVHNPTATNCCKANCSNGYCKVPTGSGEGSCSCGCDSGGYPSCKHTKV